MKLPNGYGSVYKLPGNRRKPWAVRITLSCEKDVQGKRHWKYQYLGYYKTRREGMLALASFNEGSNTSYIYSSQMTFEEVFRQWSAEHYPKISPSNIRGYNASYALCTSIAPMKFIQIRKGHLQHIIDTCGKNYPTLKKLKILFTVLYQFALENDICTKDYAQYVDIKQYHSRNPNALTRQPFSQEEIGILWQHSGTFEYISVILIMIYSGCRISELLNLKKQNVHLSEGWFDITAAKTKAGIRKVPIAAKILPFFQYWMNKNDCEYLISTPHAGHFSYQNYCNYYWKPLLEQLHLPPHHPHDTRHTCVSLLTAAQVDDKIIKKIVGHKGDSVTEVVYTHFNMEQLSFAINQI
jgi:integrase